MSDKQMLKAREARFQRLMAAWPDTGDILKGIKLEPAELVIQREYEHINIYTMAIIDPEASGWYLKYSSHGLKCMIDMRNHEEVLELARDWPKVFVGSMRVLRASPRGSCLVCELLPGSLTGGS